MIAALLLLACGAETALSDAQNYTFTSRLEAELVEVAAGQDIRVDWSALDRDLLGRSMDPTREVHGLTILVIQRAPAEVLEGLVNDSLQQIDVLGVAEAVPDAGATALPLSAFGYGGSPVLPESYLVPGRGTWVVSASTEGVPGARMLSLFEPVDDGGDDVLAISPTSSTLDWTVDLRSAEPASLAGDRVSWAGITTDMRGMPLRLNTIDGVELAAFEEDLPTLERRFPELDSLAVSRFVAPVQDAVSVELSALVDAEGRAFSGVSPHHTWLLALTCSTCENPAPPFLAVVQ